jgi:hypothetical protein
MFKPLLYLIKVLHLVVILFIVVTPLLNINYLLLLHIITIPFIMFHWILNNNTCALTIAEHIITEKITGKPVDPRESFMSNLINPVYDFAHNYKELDIMLYIVVSILFLISLMKLIKKKLDGDIKTFTDLFRIK